MLSQERTGFFALNVKLGFMKAVRGRVQVDKCVTCVKVDII